MRVFRRVILPVAWLAVFAVIAAALVKIAFVDGLKPEASMPGPGAQVAIPVVQATRATVTNTVQIKATIQSDPPAGVRSTAAGLVTHIFLEPGAKVALGDRLYQVRTELPAEEQEVQASTTAAGPAGGSAPQQAPSRPVPLYTYTDVLAPTSGTLETLTVLINQQVGVGETTGTVNPGTFTVSGPVDASQQYRLLAKPGSAEILVVGGPAPFTCSSVTLKNNAANEAAGNSSGGLAGGGAGAVGRSVPYAQAIPGGGAPQQDGTPTGTLSCAVPSGVEVFAGLGATMTVTAGESADVVTVPLTSVQGSVKEGVVWIAPAGSAAGADPNAAGVPGNPAGSAPGAGSAAGPAGAAAGNAGGPPEQRKVQLGLNDGTVVEIVSGLAEGESVLEFIPGAPAQEQFGPQFGGPGSFPAGG